MHLVRALCGRVERSERDEDGLVVTGTRMAIPMGTASPALLARGVRTQPADGPDTADVLDQLHAQVFVLSCDRTVATDALRVTYHNMASAQSTVALTSLLSSQEVSDMVHIVLDLGETWHMVASRRNYELNARPYAAGSILVTLKKLTAVHRFPSGHHY